MSSERKRGPTLSDIPRSFMLFAVLNLVNRRVGAKLSFFLSVSEIPQARSKTD